MVGWPCARPLSFSPLLTRIGLLLFAAAEEGLLALLDNLNADASLQLQDLTRSGKENVIATLQALSDGLDQNLALCVALHSPVLFSPCQAGVLDDTLRVCVRTGRWARRRTGRS